jgi:hypothetical protein
MIIKVFTPKGKKLSFDLDGWYLYNKYKWNIDPDGYVRSASLAREAAVIGYTIGAGSRPRKAQ